MGFQPALGETITIGFATFNLSGGLVNADTLPTCKVLENNNDTPILTPTVVKRSGETGTYRVTVLLSTGNGFALGRGYEIFAIATIAGTTAQVKLDNFILRESSVDTVKNLTMSIYNAMLLYGGIEITGTIDPSPTPTTTAFHVTLDRALSSAKTVAGIVGQFCTIRDGGAQTEGQPIATCTINSLTNLSLTFSVGNAFSVAPAGSDPISISE